MESGSTGGDIRDMHSGQDIRGTENMHGTGKTQDTAPSPAVGKPEPGARNPFSGGKFMHMWTLYRDMVITIAVGAVCIILWAAGSAGHSRALITAASVIVGILSVYIAGIVMRNIMQSLKSGNVGTDMLVIIALISTLATGQITAAWILCVMVCTGDVIETFAEHRAKNSISALAEAAPVTANVITGKFKDPKEALSSQWQTRDVADVCLGDTLLVRPGETVPVDGELLTEFAELNVSMINGEPLPQRALVGDRLMSGSVNGQTSLVMKVTAVSADSQYQKIIDLVASAETTKAPVVRFADRIAVPFTIAALLIGIIAWIITRDPIRFTQVMVLATPCPLLISAPVAFMGGTNRLARAHIIIKNQSVIESLTHVTHVFFDKTGTLTTTQPQVTQVELLPSWAAPDRRINGSWIIRAAGSIEAYSMHILAKGISAAGRREDAFFGTERMIARDVSELPGQGLSAQIEGYQVRVGRLDFVDIMGAHTAGDFSPLRADEMATYISVNGELAARLTLRDVPRSNAREVISQFRRQGVKHVTMLTGDRPESTAVVAEDVGITDVRAALLPEDKYNAVRYAKKTDKDKNVTTMMVGDGVNDAPVLAAADVSVAMTDGSNTAASQTAQIVIMNDDLSGINKAITISRRTVRIMLQAVVGGLAAALVFMVVSSFGVIPTIIGALIQELIDASSILWALRAAFDSRSSR